MVEQGAGGGQPALSIVLGRFEHDCNGDYGSAGRLLADKELLTDLAVRLVCNGFGSEAIGDAIAPLIQKAALREGYRPLSPQERPVIMNVKGASASGKSTMSNTSSGVTQHVHIVYRTRQRVTGTSTRSPGSNSSP